MKKLVLRFSDFNTTTQSYSLTAELRKCDRAIGEKTLIMSPARLPSVESVFQCYKDWQRFYLALLQILGHPICSPSEILPPPTTAEPPTPPGNSPSALPAIDIDGAGITNVNKEEFYGYCDRLKRKINEWLNYPEFSQVISQIYPHLSLEDDILVAIETDDLKLWRLPWHLWRFFDNYHQAEVVLSNLEFITPLTSTTDTSPWVEILAIFGDSTGIDLDHDRKILKKLLWRGGLCKFPQQPYTRKQIINALFQSRGLDILFFAGHSHSVSSYSDGTLYLHDGETLTIDQISFALQTSVRNGLQLAIFNSCNGIGLSRKLLNLRLPRVIVMREDVPNQVAAEFLKLLLQEFSQDISLPLAIRRSRERLQAIEDEFPCASWLPILCQNSATASLTWEMMKNVKSFIIWVSKWFILAVLIVTLLSIGIHKTLIKLLDFKPPIPSTSSLVEVCDLHSDLNLQINCGGNENLSFDPDLNIQTQPEKKEGMKAIANGNYDQAVKSLEAAWNDRKYASTKIYLANARIELEKFDPKFVYTIAIVVPYSDTPKFISESKLQGVADAQEEINASQNQWRLKIAIIDDKNNFGEGQKIAHTLKEKNIIGVIGPYSSHMAANVKDIYQRNRLVFISGTVTATDLASNNPDTFFFRTTTPNKLHVEKLVKYLIDKDYKKVSIYYNKGDKFTESYKEDFKKEIDSKIKIVGDHDMGEDIKKIVQNLKYEKNKYPNAAIALFPGAYLEHQANEKKLKILETINGEMLVIGSNTVYDPEVLKLKPETLKQLIIAVPWVPSEAQTKTFQQAWETEEIPNRLYGTTVDATYVMATTISQILKKGESPTREAIQQTLSAKDFQAEGITKPITFQGSERQEDFTTLIQPFCSPEGNCTWRKVQ